MTLGAATQPHLVVPHGITAWDWIHVAVIRGAAALVYSLVALRVQIGPLLGALGIGGIALAFALQDTLQNFVAGVLLQARRPIRRGDQVLLDNKFEGGV